MQDEKVFSLSDVRPSIEQALEEAGYELTSGNDEPNLIQAGRESGANSSNLVIDSGGQMRFTQTKQTGPEQSQKHKSSSGRIFDITRETTETLTVSFQLTQDEALNFTKLLSELEQL